MKVKIPLELWTGSYTTLGHLRVFFWAKCYLRIPKQKRHKWDQKRKMGRVVGYMGEKDSYRIWIPKERKIVLSRYVLFNGSNSERHVQDRKSIRVKKQPNWMTSGEFVCLVDDSQGGYCLSPTAYTEVIDESDE